MRKNESILGNFDWPLFLCYILLLIMGIGTIYSVAFDPEHPNLFDFSQKYGKQIMWLGISLFLGFLVFLIDSDIYQKFAVPIYLFTFSLLILVLFTPAINGARSWLGIGSMGIQPAEFAKIGTAILLARFLSASNIKKQDPRMVIIANAIILVPMALILMQPDAGTFVVFTSFLFVLYRVGVSYDTLINPILNFIPIRGLHFKQTWIGTHFIPILFVVVLLSVPLALQIQHVIHNSKSIKQFNPHIQNLFITQL